MESKKKQNKERAASKAKGEQNPREKKSALKSTQFFTKMQDIAADDRKKKEKTKKERVAEGGGVQKYGNAKKFML